MYDLIILGGGPAGYYAAERASEAGFHTLLFEERNLGGVCLNEGCIPTKSLLYTAKIAEAAKHGEGYGVFASGVRIDHQAALTRKKAVVRRLVSGVASSLKQGNVDARKARGAFCSRDGNGFAIEADGEKYEGVRLLVCTGSEAVIPRVEGAEAALESGFALTSREILELDSIPARLAIIGGGAIGLEFANYFNAAGAEVTVVEMLPEVGGAIDADIAKALRGELEKAGVRFRLESRMTEVAPRGVNIVSGAGSELIEADKVLLSIGRRPCVGNAGLESLGVYIENGAVVTDARMRTSVPGVWAAGDVNGKLMLAHTAYREAAVAINDMAGVPDFMRYDAVPQVVYTLPEAAGVGETGQSAAAKGLDFEELALPLQHSGRYMAENISGTGFVKLISCRRTKRILGIHIIGSYASEIILSATILVGTKWTAETARKIIFPHPTVGEALRDALNRLK